MKSTKSALPSASSAGNTPSRILRNFLLQHRKPYSLAQLADLTGLELSAESAPQSASSAGNNSAENSLATLHAQALADGLTKELEPGIYLSTLARPNSVHNSAQGRLWKYDLEAARQIIASLEAEPSWSCRTLAKRLGKSHEYMARYLTALLSIKAVKVTSQGYEAVPGASLKTLGENIQPYALLQARWDHKHQESLTNPRNLRPNLRNPRETEE